MKLLIFPIFLLLISFQLQNRSISGERKRTKNELMTHIRFLASDELRGRKTGEPETKIAARYIAEQFRAAGLKSFSSVDDYMQPIEFLINNTRENCNNVIGYIEGANVKLKNKYILLCAHYDHLGIAENTETPTSDSIYNGTRDNAMGTTALIYAAKELAKQKTERSIIFLATTGEEQGMRGSRYFIEHCPVSVTQIVFVLNNDGGGFNDTTKIRIGGKNDIRFPAGFWKALGNNIDCLPYTEELSYLYEKGDNISFAKNGIPSITISPGFDKIDENILKYVHKPEDEVNNDFDYNYLLQFSSIYAKCALKIANSQSIPFWKKDSKYFSIYNKLNKNELNINK